MTRSVLFSAVLGLCFAPPAGASLAGDIASVLARGTSKNVEYAIKVLDASTGSVVYSHQAAKPMIPASNMKIVSSAAALHYLGPEYNFETKLGLLDGSLVLIGGGDPLLGDPNTDDKYGRSPGWIFEDVVLVLKEKGVSTIDNIYIDATFFDSNRVHENWPADQLNQPYAAEISGLNYNENCIRIHVERNGSAVTWSLIPSTQYIRLINQVKPTNSGSSAVGAYRTTTPNELLLSGRCRKETRFDIAIERPAAMLGVMVYEHLVEAGIPIAGHLIEKYVKHDSRIEVLRTWSTPIGDVLARCNKDSYGVAAECFIKTLSAEHTRGRIRGEWPHGLQLVARYLESLDIVSGEFTLDDGCGLSRENRLSPNVLTTVLQSVYESENWPLFKESLSIGGVDGTTSKHFREEPYKGRLFGKTGYIDGVRTYSGVACTPESDYIFSIMTEGGYSAVRTNINDIAKAIVDNAR